MTVGSIQTLLDIRVAAPIFESIQDAHPALTLDRFKKEGVMHPVDYLFKDIYRNYWGISPTSERPPARDRTRPGLLSRQPYFRRPGRD